MVSSIETVPVRLADERKTQVSGKEASTGR
jgi:hypothetical protein